MDAAELIQLVGRGEDSRNQFKADVNNVDSLSAELVAFSNAGGGRIFIGVGNDNKVVGLSPDSVGRINQMISNAASQGVHPPVNPVTENVLHPNGIVIVLTLSEGASKPYMDKNGVIWIKSGADKRRATSREEIQRMFQDAHFVHADEVPVHSLGVGDVDIPYFEKFFKDEFGMTLDEEHLPLSQLLENMNLARAGHLNLAGALLFSKNPEIRLPSFIMKAVAFEGIDISSEKYFDSRDLTGRLVEVFRQGVSFVLQNIFHRQNGQSVNSLGEPEVPRIVWEELIANALIHRNYFISAPVRLLIFFDRVEIISPGHLPNNLTVANIRAGNSNIRNPILASFASKLMPYRGLGSGIIRALRAYPHIDFINDREGNLFRVIVKRTVISR